MKKVLLNSVCIGLAVFHLAAVGLVQAAALRLEDSRSGDLLKCVTLRTQDFSLSFVHSVSLTPVEDFYRLIEVTAGHTRIIQTAEHFITHGQGLPSMESEPDAVAFKSDNDGFVVHLHRPIDDLIVRLDARFKNRLHTDRGVINLNQWPDFTGLRIVPNTSCD